MPVRRGPRPAVLFAALAMTAGCAGLPCPPTYERRLDLPADVAAAVAAGAVRHLLPFADPVPQAAGAPARHRGGGSFAIVYERRGDGDWVPNASHRLRIDGGERATVRIEPAPTNPRMPGWGSASTERLQVEIDGDALGCAVRARGTSACAAELAQALDRAFALAVDPGAECVGLAEPNLAAWTCDRSLASARRLLGAGEPARAEEQLLRAARLRGLGSPQQHELGELAAQSGDLPEARARLGAALLLSDDPTARAHLAARLLALDAPRAGPTSRPGTPAELAVAAVRLHTARREHSEPALDYHLQSQLHRQDHDDLAAVACALLAREHTLPAAWLLAREQPLRRGLDDFVRQAMLAVEPVCAGDDGEPRASRPAAAPGP